MGRVGKHHSRESALLESEWNLRVVLLGSTFVSSLLVAPTDVAQGNQVVTLLDLFRQVLGPTSTREARERLAAAVTNSVAAWQATSNGLEDFWPRGQSRSIMYERALRSLYPTYDQASAAYLSYRPDLIVSDFVPCSLLSATSEVPTALSKATQRVAVTWEFTSQQRTDGSTISDYLGQKLANYVRVTQEQ